MTPDERQLLTGLFDRIRGASTTSRDPEADTLIAEATKAQPYAPYFLAQTVLVQDQALRAANDRLQELESKVKELESQSANAPRSGSFLSGLGSLFGGGPAPRPRPTSPPPGSWGPAPRQGGWQTQAPPPPPPPGYGQPAPGPWGSTGAPASGGFLKGALGTAAGVAGGVLLADSIRDLFSGHNNALGIGTGYTGLGGGLGSGLGSETIVNNYYGTDEQSLRDYDASQDAQQDAADDQRFADYQQDADQDQDDIQDASDLGSDDFSGGDDGSYDV